MLKFQGLHSDGHNPTHKTTEKEPMKKTNKLKNETINIIPTTPDLFVQYAQLYSNMNSEGKQMIETQLRAYGVNYDLMKKVIKTDVEQKPINETNKGLN